MAQALAPELESMIDAVIDRERRAALRDDLERLRGRTGSRSAPALIGANPAILEHSFAARSALAFAIADDSP